MENNSNRIKAKKILSEFSFDKDVYLSTISLNKWISDIIPLLPYMEKDDLIKSLHLMTKIKFYDFQFMKNWTENAKLKIQHFTPEDIAKVLYYLAKIGHRNLESLNFISQLIKILFEKVATISTINLSNSIWALSKLEYRDKKFLEFWCQTAIGKIEEFNEKAMAKSIAAIAMLDFYDQAFLENWINTNEVKNYSYSQRVSVNNLFYLSMLYINNPGINTEKIYEFIIAKADSIDCLYTTSIEEKRQILVVGSSINGFLERLTNFNGDTKNTWLDEIDKQSSVITTFTQRKIAAFIANPPIEFKVEEEKFSSITMSHLDIVAKYRDNLFAIQDDGLVHYYRNDRINYPQNFAAIQVNAKTRFNTFLLQKHGHIVVRINSREVYTGEYKTILCNKLIPYKLDKENPDESIFPLTQKMTVDASLPTKEYNFAKKSKKQAKVHKSKLKEISDKEFDEAISEMRLYNEALSTVENKSLDEEYKKIKSLYKTRPKDQSLLTAAINKLNIEHINFIIDYNNASSRDYSATLDIELSVIIDKISTTTVKETRSILYEICKTLLLKRIQLKEYFLSFDLQLKAQKIYSNLFQDNEVELCNMFIDHLSNNIVFVVIILDYLFIRAVSNKKLDMVQILLDKGADVNFKYLDSGLPNSFTTALNGGVVFCNFLGEPISSGMTALHIATMLEWTDGVKILLKNHANPNVINSEGSTPLTVALCRNNNEIFNLILRYNPNPNFLCLFQSQELSMIHAAAMMSPEILKSILNIGNIDINIQDAETKVTPLIVAVLAKNLKSIKLLVEVGKADINLVDSDGFNAFMHAIRNVDMETYKPISITQQIKKLPQNSILDKNIGYVNLHEEIANGVDIVQYFIDQSADLTIVNDKGISLLTLAVASGNIEILKLLITKKEIQAHIDEAPFVLICAAFKGYTEVIKILLQVGASIDIIDDCGYSPLIYAVQENHIETATYLIEAGADLSVKNNDGATALDFAINGKHKELEQLIIKKIQSYRTRIDEAVKINNIGKYYFSQGDVLKALICRTTAYKKVVNIKFGHLLEIKDVTENLCLSINSVANQYKKKSMWEGNEYDRIVTEIRDNNTPIPYASISRTLDMIIDNYIIMHNEKSVEFIQELIQEQSKDILSKISYQTTKEHESLNLKRTEKLAFSGTQLRSLQELLRSSALQNKAKSADKMNAASSNYMTKAERISSYYGSILLLPEFSHIYHHKENILKIVNMIKNKEVQPHTVIFLERKQDGNNLGMNDVLSLAEILKTYDASGIILPDYIFSSFIYYDALLYNCAKEESIIVLGIEKKGLPYSKNSLYYNHMREEYMVKNLLTIVSSSKNVIFLVGAAHINNLIRLLGKQGFNLSHNSLAFTEESLITLKFQRYDKKELLLNENLLVLSPILLDIQTISFTPIVNGDKSTSATPDIEIVHSESHGKQYNNFCYSLLQFHLYELIEKTDLNWQLKKLFYFREIWRYNAIKEKYIITQSIEIFRESDFGFKKHVLLRLHPDKGGNAQDFVFVNELHEKLNKDLNLREIIDKRLHLVQPIVRKASTGFKVLDIVTDTIRLVCQPNFANAKKIAFDFSYLYSMYSGFNGYSLFLSGVDSLYQCYQGKQNQAFKQIIATASYIALPTILSYSAIPYLGFAYGTVMAGFTGYHAITNTYSLYKEYNTVEWQLKSAMAYKNLYETLVNSKLQQVYDFASDAKRYETKINDINFDIEKAQIKQQLEEKGEFGNKLYEHIYIPTLEGKYGLLQAKHVVLTIGEQYYEHCISIVSENDNEPYNCYNMDQEVVDRVVIGEDGIVQSTEKL